MPDFIIECAEVCSTNMHWEKEIRSSRGGGETYTVRYSRQFEPESEAEYGYSCTCKGFRYRGKCRHIMEAVLSEEHCRWNEGCDPGMSSDDGVCPGCGGPIVAVRVGV